VTKKKLLYHHFHLRVQYFLLLNHRRWRQPASGYLDQDQCSWQRFCHQQEKNQNLPSALEGLFGFL
jgi:hypothetical protein